MPVCLPNYWYLSVTNNIPMLRSTIRLFLVLITLTVIMVSWLSGQLGSSRIQILIGVLIGISIIAFILLNVADRREEARRRKERESKKRPEVDPDRPRPKRADVDYSLKERKSGLTWGGGNIKASEAKRGTKRTFLGK